MRPKQPRHCSYIVPIETAATAEELQRLAAHLSTLGVAGCDVVVVDPAPREALAERRRILRWVARHLPAEGDVLQSAAAVALADKIIIASPDSRYTAVEVAAICAQLDRFDAVQPEEFVDPMPWWGAIDAGRMLLHRGLDQPPGERRTFAFRRSAWKPLLDLEVQPVRDVFVRHEAPELSAWLRSRMRSRAFPLETAVFACILPLLMILGVLGGFEVAGGYAGVVAFASVLVALRGRTGAGRFFPLRACLFAPLAIVERSLSVYCSLFRMRRAADGDAIIPGHAPTAVDHRPLLRPSSDR